MIEHQKGIKEKERSMRVCNVLGVMNDINYFWLELILHDMF